MLCSTNRIDDAHQGLGPVRRVPAALMTRVAASPTGPEFPRTALGELLRKSGALMVCAAPPSPAVRASETIRTPAPTAAAMPATAAEALVAVSAVVGTGAEARATRPEPEPEAVLAHAQHRHEPLLAHVLAHVPARLGEPRTPFSVGIGSERVLGAGDDLIQQTGHRGGLLLGEGVEVVGASPASAGVQNRPLFF